MRIRLRSSAILAAMHAEFTFQLATIYGFLLALARVSGVVVFVPIPGFSAGPDASRVVLALALTIALFPAWPTLATRRRIIRWLRAGCSERSAQKRVFGVTVGLAIAFLLEGVQMAAQVLGLQAGYSYASTVDPTTQADTTTLQLMAQLLAGTLFFAFGFDRQVLASPGKKSGIGAGACASHSTGAPLRRLWALARQSSPPGCNWRFPVLALLVLLDIAFAVLGRLHAQLQLLSLSFAIKMLVALAFLAVVLSVYPGRFRAHGRDHIRGIGSSAESISSRTHDGGPRPAHRKTDQAKTREEPAGGPVSRQPGIAGRFAVPHVCGPADRGGGGFLRTDARHGPLLSGGRLSSSGDASRGSCGSTRCCSDTYSRLYSGWAAA